MKQRIYFDNAATTPVDKRVLESMLPYFSTHFGNASSLHTFGTQAKEVLEISKAKISGYLNALPEEIIFTSSGTEANNLALKGIAFANRHKGNHIIVSSIEHDCVLNTCKWLEGQGFYVTYLPVDSTGTIDIEYLKKVINSKTILVSVMHANNEIGTIEPIAEIGNICRQQNVYFHSDACQSFGKLAIDVNNDHLDLLTINSHKMYGPKGVGALYIRKGTRITPLFHGGGQEEGLRSSTENIPGIVGFSKAVELSMNEMDSEKNRLISLRRRLINFLVNKYDNVYFNGHTENRLPGHLSFSFQGMEGETIRLLLMLDELGIAVSAGSACSSNDKTNNASHVLQAIGLNPFEARGAIRLSLGRFTTENDLDFFESTFSNVMNSLNPIFSFNTLSNNQ
jgi:cysteine desulfurase